MIRSLMLSPNVLFCRVEQRRWCWWLALWEAWSLYGLSSSCLASLARILLLINYALRVDFMFLIFFFFCFYYDDHDSIVSLHDTNSVGFFWGEVMLYWTIIWLLILSYRLFFFRKKKKCSCLYRIQYFTFVCRIRPFHMLLVRMPYLSIISCTFDIV